MAALSLSQLKGSQEVEEVESLCFTWAGQSERSSVQIYDWVDVAEPRHLLLSDHTPRHADNHPLAIVQKALLSQWPLLHLEPRTALDGVHRDRLKAEDCGRAWLLPSLCEEGIF